MKPVDDLFAELCAHRIDSYRDYLKEFVFIRKIDFERFREFFQPSKNILNNDAHYRSKHALRHVHAHEHKDVVNVHIDVGNTDRNILLGLIHLLCDILPYELYCLCNYGKLNSGGRYTELDDLKKK